MLSCTTSHVDRESDALTVDVLLAPSLVVTSALKYFSEIFARVPSAASFLSAASASCCSCGLVLAEGQRLLERLVACVARDLDLVVAGGREVVEHRDVVVDDRVDPALHHQLHTGSEVLHVLHVRAGVTRDLRPVAAGGLRRRTPLQVGERGDVVGVLGGDDDAVGVGVRRAEEVARLALRVDRHLVGDHVDPTGVQGREERVERRLGELHVPAGLFADRLHHLDVEAGQLVGVRVAVGERRVGALGADLDDRLGVVGVRRGREAEQHRAREQQRRDDPGEGHPPRVPARARGESSRTLIGCRTLGR